MEGDLQSERASASETLEARAMRAETCIAEVDAVLGGEDVGLRPDDALDRIAVLVSDYGAASSSEDMARLASESGVGFGEASEAEVDDCVVPAKLRLKGAEQCIEALDEMLDTRCASVRPEAVIDIMVAIVYTHQTWRLRQVEQQQ